jgi:hypothetical protein
MPKRLALPWTAIIAALVCLHLPAAQADWELKTAMTDARFDPSIATDGTGKIFIMGGVNGLAFAIRLSAVYNIATNAWTGIISMPGFVASGKGAYFEGKVFLPGGLDDGTVNPAMYVYHDQLFPYWDSTHAAAPQGRYGYSFDKIDRSIYLCGGADSSDTARAECWAYSPDTDQWNSIPPMATARKFHGSGVISNKLFVFGGQNTLGGELAGVGYYDPIQGEWNEGAQMPVSWYGGVGVAVREQLAFSHGYSLGNMFGGTYIYDVSMDEWSLLEGDVVETRLMPGGVAAAGAMWAMAGDPDNLFGFPSNLVECRYDVTTTTTTSTTTTTTTTTTTHASTTTTVTTTSTGVTTTTHPSDDDSDDDVWHDDTGDDTEVADDDDDTGGWGWEDDTAPDSNDDDDENASSGGCGG